MATKTETINIRVGPKLKDDLARIAEAREMTIGELVRFVLIMYASDPQSITR
jgi:antitoxin component of RelBE/YafQ-DinJ toxin-antitoxin module